MADNLVIKDGVGQPKTLATQESNGVHTPKHIVTYSELPNGAATAVKQDALGIQLGAINETAYAGSGGKGLNGLLKGIYNLLSGKIAIQPHYAASGVTPLTGDFTATGSSDSIILLAGRNFNVTLSGTFEGEVRLERSFDDGSSWHPLTAAGYQYFSFTAPCSEIHVESEVGVEYRLTCTDYTSGTISYRISQ